jgi:hypothetical protein
VLASIIAGMVEIEPELTLLKPTEIDFRDYEPGMRFASGGVVMAKSTCVLKVCHSRRSENCAHCKLTEFCPASLTGEVFRI